MTYFESLVVTAFIIGWWLGTCFGYRVKERWP
jgi:hypothetical protein